MANPLRQDVGAWLGLWAAGTGLLVFAAAGPWIVATRGYGVFIPVLAVSGLATLVAAKLAVKLPARTGLIVILGLALAMRLAVVGEVPLLSTDVYRYVWDGRVQAAGINPYAFVPADPALLSLRDNAIFARINRADYAVTIYPPVAQMYFLAVTRIAETITMMRLAMVACEIVTVLVIIDLLRRLDRPVTAVVAYAWHPLAVWEVANNGHVDALMVALLMGGVWLAIRARALAGAIAIALATLVKPYAILALPAIWRPWDWRVPLIVVATILLCYLPYLGVGSEVLGFLAGYVSEEGLASGEGIWLVSLVQAVFGPVPGLTAAYLAAAAVVMAWLAVRGALRRDPSPQSVIRDVTVLLTAGLFLASPNYAWYFLALVPFLALGAGAPLWALTLGAVLLYRPALLPHNDLAWKTVAILPFLIAWLMTLRHRAPIQEPGASAWRN